MPKIENGALIAGRYLLDARLDSGGRAQVWTATDEELKRDVAVKLLLTPEGGDPAFVEAFRAEAQIEAGLNHPNIVEVFDWGHDDNANFVVMELHSGETVARLVEKNGPFLPDRVIGVGRQLASALVYAHAEGVAHGSIGSDRVIIGPDGRATLVDFGLHCRGDCEYPAVPDADTLALGGLLYEMLTGVSPMGPRPVNVADDEPWPAHPHKLNPAVSTDLDHIVMKAIAADSAERYQTAAELEAALDALVQPKRRTWLWAMLALLAVLLVVIGLVVFTSQMTVLVPDVVGRTQAEAEATLSSAGLSMVVTGQTTSESVEQGAVASEDPLAGSRVRRGTQVGVMLSSGGPTVGVPAVTGLDIQVASSAIASAGLVLGTATSRADSTFPAGAVISQSPAAGAQVAVGGTVDLVVSAGKAQVAVPDVRGMSQASATAELDSLGLVVDVAAVFSAQPNGVVVSQGPAGGSTVAPGGTVTISVSKGSTPVRVPNVTGAVAADAKTSLQDLGLVPVSVPTTGTAAQVGTVIRQSPAAGSRVSPGSQVRLFIGK